MGSMSSTPKAVRRNWGGCICENRSRVSKTEEAGACKWGYCVVFRCPVCRGELAGWGPVSCPGHGHPRAARHPGMEQPGHWDLERNVFVPARAAVKPSVARRRNRRRASSMMA
jgi:hypothetical protein